MARPSKQEIPGYVIKPLLKAGVFLILLLLVVEQSYRIYSLGSAAFSPRLFNSYNLLLKSDFVRLSEFPDIYFELKPDLDGWYRGNRFTTNSAGLADREYAREKPAGVTRVAVVGSSWTMATGVPQEAAWHARLESELNRGTTPPRFEFINFGVEYYGLRELVATVRHKVPLWQPDILHVDLTTFTGYLLWDTADPGQRLPAKATPFFQSYALRALAAAAGIGIYDGAMEGRPTVGGDVALAHDQTVRALREIAALAAELDVPVVFSWLSFGRPGPQLDQRLRTLASELGLVYVPAYESIRQRGHRKGQPITASHPDAETHRIIARRVRGAMAASGLLPSRR